MLKLSLNGEMIQCEERLSLAQLLEQKNYQSQKIAVAINGEFVPRSLYDETVLGSEDEVDVIQAVGGG